MSQIATPPESPMGQSKVYVLFYSFFLIPLMVTVFGILFFLSVKFFTHESNDPYEYLNQVRVGSASKRWQSAYELSKLLSASVPEVQEEQFKRNLMSAFKKSIHDDPKVRMYLALAMGKTGDTFFGPTLLESVGDELLEVRLATIQSLGIIQYNASLPTLSNIIQETQFTEERLAAAVAIGQIGDPSSIHTLRGLLEDEEPNIRWDAAIALAKMGDDLGANIINKLLDRKYYQNFSRIDTWETENAILVAIQITYQLQDIRFKNNLMTLAQSDPNMKIRDAAYKSLQVVYKWENNNG